MHWYGVCGVSKYTSWLQKGPLLRLPLHHFSDSGLGFLGDGAVTSVMNSGFRRCGGGLREVEKFR
jgi:hypothetical protein